MKNGLCVFVFSIVFLSGTIFSPTAFAGIESESIGQIDANSIAATGYVPGDIRVAIYDEPNRSAPSYATYPGGINNNATGLMDILVDYGYDVTLLHVQDIYNYELTTLNYDVFCMVDNFPRENITSRVMDFWLGGGGLLAFDGAAGFLCYFGILPSAAVGTSGYPNYWDYAGANFVFTGLHPVSKSVTLPYGINTVSGGYLVWDFPMLFSAVGTDVTKVATSSVSPDDASILAYDPSNRGGKVVTIAVDMVHDYPPELSQIYADAVEWLAPKPKARVLYDLTHQPWCPTDSWEWSGDSNYLTTWRNDLVANHYVVDKLHPSPFGNLTAENLAPYDMLVTNQPMLNISASEIQAVKNWVQAGGGLFVIGDNPGVPDNYRLDELIAPYGFQFNDTAASYSTGVGMFDMHPTTEACTSLLYVGATNLILSGAAYPIWKYSDGEAASGAAEYGSGRVVVICDTNSVLDSWIGSSDNEQFAMNIANWLTTSSAGVLLYHDSTGVNPYNYYRSAVANALNELGIEFMLTFDRDYFNLSMNLKGWDLIISDANSYSPVYNYRFIKQHLENGGRLIMRDFLFRYPNGTSGFDLSLYPYMGFEGCGVNERIIDGAPSIYIWDVQHPIFGRPVDFSVDHFDSTANFYSTDWTNVTVLNNATAIAGITSTPEVNQSAIVLGVDGRALCNMFSISQYYDDYDQSTYPDNFELWLNEIAFMMRPTIDSPGDLQIDLAGPVSEFQWGAYSYAPADYQVKRNSTTVVSQTWTGSSVVVDVTGLPVGVYEYELAVYDVFGYQATDTIIVTIIDTTPTTTHGEPPPIPGDLLLLVILGAAGVVVVVVVLFLMKKKRT